jgi:hypothetical protein
MFLGISAGYSLIAILFRGRSHRTPASHAIPSQHHPTPCEARPKRFAGLLATARLPRPPQLPRSLQWPVRFGYRARSSGQSSPWPLGSGLSCPIRTAPLSRRGCCPGVRTRWHTGYQRTYPVAHRVRSAALLASPDGIRRITGTVSTVAGVLNGKRPTLPRCAGAGLLETGFRVGRLMVGWCEGCGRP